MNDRELLEFIAAQVGGLTKDVSGLTKDVNELKEDINGFTKEMNGFTKDVDGLTVDMGKLSKDVSELKEGQVSIGSELGNLKKITLNIEEKHGKQLTALFDGYKQNEVKLDRIEKEVSKHEEIILRRIK